jgi:hypothetical protein
MNGIAQVRVYPFLNSHAQRLEFCCSFCLGDFLAARLETEDVVLSLPQLSLKLAYLGAQNLALFL